ncbi:MAG: hypothetical protein R3C03_02080 [Pirellulaceae bacterium]
MDLKELVSQLDSEEFQVRLQAFQEINRHRAEILIELERLLETERFSPETRYRLQTIVDSVPNDKPLNPRESRRMRRLILGASNAW